MHLGLNICHSEHDAVRNGVHGHAGRGTPTRGCKQPRHETLKLQGCMCHVELCVCRIYPSPPLLASLFSAPLLFCLGET